MKKRLILAAAAVFALSGVGVAQARDNISWSISVGDPFLGAVISNARPVYRYAEPVYVEPPPVVYVPAPRVVYPQPYVAVPYGYVYAERDRWEHHRHHEHWDRDWRNDDRRDWHDRDDWWQRR